MGMTLVGDIFVEARVEVEGGLWLQSLKTEEFLEGVPAFLSTKLCRFARHTLVFVVPDNKLYFVDGVRVIVMGLENG